MSGSFAPSSTVEQAIRQRLQIKYVDAKQLASEAQRHLGISGLTCPPEERDAVIQEACMLFSRMSPDEQERMRAKPPAAPAAKAIGTNDTGDDGETEFQRKARLAAERRASQQQLLEQEKQSSSAGTTPKPTPASTQPVKGIKRVKRPTGRANANNFPSAADEYGDGTTTNSSGKDAKAKGSCIIL